MKKVLIIAFSLLLLVGCNKKEEVVEKKEPVVKFTLEKIDNDKDYVYFSNYKEVVFKDDRYLYKYPVVNIKGNDIENLNLELKNFVINSFKDAEIYENKLSSGNIIDYKEYVTDAINCRGSNVYEFTITKRWRTITVNSNGSWNFDSLDWKVSRNIANKIDYTDSEINLSEDEKKELLGIPQEHLLNAIEMV